MIKNKYGLDIKEETLAHNIDRLTNQIWKLIPMKENGENWEVQIEKVIIEITGLNEILINNDGFLTLLMNLEGLKETEVEFNAYRSKVFESINLLREAFKKCQN